ncbi:MAG TPA: hypothetical protein IAB22_00600 [Candidatus Merdivicinus intestinavium]|nr:hypothetical protein [Candidatus Merdivicinus intestinavium]
MKTFLPDEPAQVSVLRALTLLAVLAALCAPLLPWMVYRLPDGGLVPLAPLLFWAGPAASALPGSCLRCLNLLALCCAAGSALLAGVGISLFTLRRTEPLLSFLCCGFWLLVLPAGGALLAPLLAEPGLFRPQWPCFAALLAGLAGAFLSARYRRFAE